MNPSRQSLTINQRDVEYYFELVSLTPVQVQSISHSLTQININQSNFVDHYVHQLRCKTRFSHPHIQDELTQGALYNSICQYIRTWLTCTHIENSFQNHVRLVTELNAHGISVAEFLLLGLKIKTDLLFRLRIAWRKQPIKSIKLVRDFSKWLTVHEHILRNIELSLHLQKLRQATSFRDDLTKSYSKAVFLEELERAIQLCDRKNQSLIVIHFDINQLNTVNHTYGFQIGDDVLKIFAQTCIEQLSKTEVVARDDDEFFIILPDAPITDAQQVFQRLVNSFDRSIKIPITLSAGASRYYPDSDLTLEDLLGQAKRQLINAKVRSIEAGTHKCCVDIRNQPNNIIPFMR